MTPEQGNLALTRTERHEQDAVVVDFTARLLAELLTAAQGAASSGDLSPVAVFLTQWRHTAEVYADPALVEILTLEPVRDLGPVPMPDGEQ